MRRVQHHVVWLGTSKREFDARSSWWRAAWTPWWQTVLPAQSREMPAVVGNLRIRRSAAPASASRAARLGQGHRNMDGGTRDVQAA